jgi:hypothetical protein
MTSLALIAAGLVTIGLVISDRGEIRKNWRQPARWWRLSESFDARAPSQPGNIVLGIVLGAAAIIYGVVTLLT